MTAEQTVATQIAEYSPTAAGLTELRSRLANVVYDVATTAGMERARKDRRECVTLRTSLDKLRAEIKAPALERCRLIDAEAKRISVEILALEEPIDQAIKAEEARRETEKAEKLRIEAERIAALRARVDSLARAPLAAVGNNSAQIAEQLDALRATVIDADFEEFEADARTALAGALAQLELSRQAAVAHEAEQARIVAEREELARLRQAEEARIAEARRLAEEEERRLAEQRREEEERLRAERAAEDERRRQEEAAARATREEEDRKRRAELAAQEEAARVVRESEERRIAEERAAVERQREEDERQRKADAERRAQEDVRQQAERDRIASQKAEFEAAQKRAAVLLKARRGTAAIALQDILKIARNEHVADRDARDEIALIAEATLQPKQAVAA